jgi:hypothetical protein
MHKDALAPLTSLEPERLVSRDGKDSLAEFVLALSLVFNDLKGIVNWRDYIMLQPPPDTKVISPELGEWIGFDMQTHRLMVAQLHELLRLIEEFKEVVEGDEMRRIIKKAPASTRRRWDEIVRIATGKGGLGDDIFATILVKVRNNASYHYYQPKTLVAGFRDFFFKAPKDAGNEWAYVSIGDNMGQTRFYFADAAMQATLYTLTEKPMGAKFAKRFGDVIEDVNQALAYIIGQYIKRAKPRTKSS